MVLLRRKKLNSSDYLLKEGWKVYIRLVGDRGLSSSLIKLGTRSKYSHGEFIVTDEKGRKVVTLGSMFDPLGDLDGVQLRPVDHIKPMLEHWFTATGIENAYLYALQQLLGSPYDYLAILGVGVNEPWHVANNCFCTEAIAKSFLETGNPLFNTTGVQPWRVTPRDIATSLAVSLYKVVV